MELRLWHAAGILPYINNSWWAQLRWLTNCKKCTDGGALVRERDRSPYVDALRPVVTFFFFFFTTWGVESSVIVGQTEQRKHEDRVGVPAFSGSSLWPDKIKGWCGDSINQDWEEEGEWAGGSGRGVGRWEHRVTSFSNPCCLITPPEECQYGW